MDRIHHPHHLPLWSVRCRDGQRTKYSPYFRDESAAIDWLNSAETREDHGSRFESPVYSIECWIPVGRELVNTDFRYVQCIEGRYV